MHVYNSLSEECVCGVKKSRFHNSYINYFITAACLLLRPPSARLRARRGEGEPRGASIIPWKRLITRLTTQTRRPTGSGTGCYEITWMGQGSDTRRCSIYSLKLNSFNAVLSGFLMINGKGKIQKVPIKYNTKR